MPRSTRGAAGDADFGGFIKSVFCIVNGRRAQMQSTGRSVAERTSPAFGCIRFKVTDVTEPGGSFHVVAWALQTNRSDRSISAIAQLPFRHYAYGLAQRQAEVWICMKRQVFLDPSAGKGIILLTLVRCICPSVYSTDDTQKSIIMRRTVPHGHSIIQSTRSYPDGPRPV